MRATTESDVNIDLPRLIHGSYFRNLEQIFREGSLIPQIDKGGKKGISLKSTGLIYFNVSGVPVDLLPYRLSLETVLERAIPDIATYLAASKGRSKFKDWVFNRSPGHIFLQLEEKIIYEDDNIKVFFGSSPRRQYHFVDGELKRTATLMFKQDYGPNYDLFDRLKSALSSHPSRVTIVGEGGVAYDDTVKAELQSEPRNLGLAYLKQHVPESVWTEIDSGLNIPTTIEGLKSDSHIKHGGVDFFFLVDEEVFRRGESYICNPYSLAGCGHALNSTHIEVIQKLRESGYQIPVELKGDFFDGSGIEGFYTVISIPLQYVVGIVLPPVEQKYVDVENCEEPPPVANTADAIVYIKDRMKNIKIPLFDMEGNCLYNPK